jgi:hypothetical protein
LEKIEPVGKRKTIMAWFLVFALCAVILGVSFFFENKKSGFLVSADTNTSTEASAEKKTNITDKDTKGLVIPTQKGTSSTAGGNTGPASTGCNQANDTINSEISQEINRIDGLKSTNPTKAANAKLELEVAKVKTDNQEKIDALTLALAKAFDEISRKEIQAWINALSQKCNIQTANQTAVNTK